jgi:hypothetical protein
MMKFAFDCSSFNAYKDFPSSRGEDKVASEPSYQSAGSPSLSM